MDTDEIDSFYSSILSGRRMRTSSVKGRTIEEESASDKARIIFSSAFRRLQQKAQVFSLENNAAVRTRLSHSLEVAEIGARIARIICNTLCKHNKFNENLSVAFIQFVENACLVHDIGNPPFGHFGETAISKWFKDNGMTVFAKSLGPTIKAAKSNPEYKVLQSFMPDFYEFDGNPQGIRIITRLQSIDNDDMTGLNLTFTQILSLLKYTRSTQKLKGVNNRKKPAYFQSERCIIEDMKKALGVEKSSRFPLSYIMEAADDISYCLSDMEDGIEKRIISYSDIFEYFYSQYMNIDSEGRPSFINDFIHDFTKLFSNRHAKTDAMSISKTDENILGKRFFLKLKTQASDSLIKKAADLYQTYHQSVIRGDAIALFSLIDSKESRFLELTKKFARKYLYQSNEAEKIELAGYKIISSLLESFEPILKLPKLKFVKLAHGESAENTDYERRLFNKIPSKYVDVYKDVMKDENNKINASSVEWFHRAHMITDYISGMTDDYALETYRNLMGISLN